MWTGRAAAPAWAQSRASTGGFRTGSNLATGRPIGAGSTRPTRIATEAVCAAGPILDSSGHSGHPDARGRLWRAAKRERGSPDHAARLGKQWPELTNKQLPRKMRAMGKKRTKLTDQLRQAIQTSGKSRYQIGQETGIDPATLWRFMHGSRGLSMEGLDRIGDCLGLEIHVRKAAAPRKRKGR